MTGGEIRGSAGRKKGTSGGAAPGRANTEKVHMDNRLYVGNLAYATTEADIRQLFAKSGKVIAVELARDQNTGQSKGFAFVTMGTPAQAQAAIGRLHDSTFAKRRLTVNLARPPAAAPGFQSRFNALGANRPTSALPGRNQKPAPGGYQSRYSAFGAQSPQPAQPRRRNGRDRRP